MKIKEEQQIGLGIGLITILVISFSPTILAQNYGITGISNEPNIAVLDEYLIFTIEFEDTSDIDNVRILICQLSPEFICEPQPTLTEPTDSGYVGEFLVDYEVGAKLGYKFLISYSNGTDLIVPDRIDFLGITNIVEPVTGDYYIEVDIQEDTEKTLGYIAFIVISGLLIITIIRKRLFSNNSA